jgi:hypothetical protein
MGKLATVTHEGSEITLSMVKWGVLRRTMLSFTRPNIARLGVGWPTSFIPQYEIAIYGGSPKVVFSKQPTFIFYYPDKETALEKWDELVAIIKQGGLYGTGEFIRDGDPKKQGVLTNLFPSLKEA